VAEGRGPDTALLGAGAGRGRILIFGPRPRFSLTTFLRSLIVPLAWIPCILLRSPFLTYTQDGQTRHWYPYHFINVDDIGYGRAVLNIVGVFVLLIAVGRVFVVLDRKLRPRPTA
jgi:hypothetical protein